MPARISQLYGEATHFDASYDLPPGFQLRGGRRRPSMAQSGRRGCRVAARTIWRCGARRLPAPSVFLQSPSDCSTQQSLTSHVPRLQYTSACSGSSRSHRRVMLTLSAGPSFISYKQDIITNLVLTETYPYDSVPLARAVTAQRDGVAIGGYASGDAYLKLTRHVAVGGGARFSRATDDVESLPGQSVSNRNRRPPGRRRRPVAVLKRRTATPFARRVLAAVRRIPPGRVVTYGDIAAWQDGLARREPSATSCARRPARGAVPPRHRRRRAAGGYGGQEA